MHIAEAFDADRWALVAACRRVADAATRGPFPDAARFAVHAREVAEALEAGDWEAQASAAASLRGWFHRDGVADWPDPQGALTWTEDLKTLVDLSTIYVESRYGEVARARSAA
jgi:hypothetical protein